MRGGGADERHPVFGDDIGELGVLGKETVAWMDRLRIGHFGGRDDTRHIQIAFRCSSWPDTYRLVGHANVFEVAIHRGVHSHCLDAQRMAGAQHAAARQSGGAEQQNRQATALSVR